MVHARTLDGEMKPKHSKAVLLTEGDGEVRESSGWLAGQLEVA